MGLREEFAAMEDRLRQADRQIRLDADLADCSDVEEEVRRQWTAANAAHSAEMERLDKETRWLEEELVLLRRKRQFLTENVAAFQKEQK